MKVSLVFYIPFDLFFQKMYSHLKFMLVIVYSQSVNMRETNAFLGRYDNQRFNIILAKNLIN